MHTFPLFTHSIIIRLSPSFPWDAHRIFNIFIIAADNLLNFADQVLVAILIVQFPMLTSDHFRPSKQPTNFKLGGSPSFSNVNSYTQQSLSLRKRRCDNNRINRSLPIMWRQGCGFWPAVYFLDYAKMIYIVITKTSCKKRTFFSVFLFFSFANWWMTCRGSLRVNVDWRNKVSSCPPPMSPDSTWIEFVVALLSPKGFKFLL